MAHKIGDKVKFEGVNTGDWEEGTMILVERYPAGQHYRVVDRDREIWDCCESQVRPG